MVQTRWALQLQQLLRTHRSKLSIEVPWRPWYLMLRRTVLRDDLEYEGGSWRRGGAGTRGWVKEGV